MVQNSTKQIASSTYRPVRRSSNLSGNKAFAADGDIALTQVSSGEEQLGASQAVLTSEIEEYVDNLAVDIISGALV